MLDSRNIASFPPQFRTIFTSNSPILSKLQEIEALLADPLIHKSYTAWAKAHTSLVKNNGIIGNVDALAKRMTAQGGESRIKGIKQYFLTRTRPPQNHAEYLKDQIELLSCGLITPAECASHFFRNGIYHASDLCLVLPQLQKMEEIDILKQFLCVVDLDGEGGTVFARQDTAKVCLPLLDIFSPEEVADILLTSNEKKHTPFHSHLTGPLFESHLLKCKPQTRLKVMSAPNEIGYTALQFLDSGSSINPDWYKDIDLDDLFALLTMQTNEHKHFPLQFTNVALSILPYLSQFHHSQLKKLFEVRDNDGKGVLHVVAVQNILWNFLETHFSVEELTGFLFVYDNTGGNPIQYKLRLDRTSSLLFFLPYIHQFLIDGGNFEQIKQLFETISEGSIYLATPHGMKSAKTLLLNILSQNNGARKVYEILALCNDRGSSALHIPGAFAEARPILEALLVKEEGVEYIIKLLTKTDVSDISPLHHKSALEFLFSIKSETMTRARLRSIFLQRTSNGNGTLFSKAIKHSKEVCEKALEAFGIDLNIDLPIDSSSAITKLIEAWKVRTKGSTTESPLYIYAILGNIDRFIDKLNEYSPQQREILYRQCPELAEEMKQSLVARKHDLNMQHMHEGANLHSKPPEAYSFKPADFGFEGESYPHFYSFIDDAIKAAEKQNLLTDSSKANLRNIENNIKSNAKLEGTLENPEKRREQYRVYCSYLSHVVAAYKIDQDNVDKQAASNKLTHIGTTAECFPRWMQEIVQIYTFRPGASNIPTTPPNLKDRVLARLRVQRIHVLTVRLLQYSFGVVHERNYLLNLFRTRLGTYLDYIEDPHSIIKNYPVSEEELYKSFLTYYNKATIVKDMAEYLHSQKTRTTDNIDPLDFTPDEVEFTLREWAKTSWKVKEYNEVVNVVIRMQQKKKPENEIHTFLEGHGIEWRKEETVEETENRLDTQLTRIKWEKRSKAQQGGVLDETLVALESRLNKLKESLQGHTSEEKKNLLQGYLIPGETLGEVLKQVDTYRVNRFIETEVYDESRNFTTAAAVRFLEALNILTPK